MIGTPVGGREGVGTPYYGRRLLRPTIIKTTGKKAELANKLTLEIYNEAR